MKKEIRTRLEGWQEEIMDEYNKKIKYYTKKDRGNIVDKLLEEIEEACKVWGYDCIGKDGKCYYGINYEEIEEMEDNIMKNYFEELVEKHDEVIKTYEDFHSGEGTQEAWDFALEELESKIDKVYDSLSEEEKAIIDSWYERL